MPKQLAEADTETGLEFERELEAALVALNSANDAYQRYVAILRRKYEAPDGEWTLTDWAIGFERVTREEEA